MNLSNYKHFFQKKSRQAVETTMTMSRVPQFCARRWSQIPKLSYQNPKIPQLGIIEPWPECQPLFISHLFHI